MTIYDRPAAHRGWLPPGLGRLAFCAAAATLIVLPRRLTEPLKTPLVVMLRPALAATAGAGRGLQSVLARIGGLTARSAHVARLEQQLEELQARNERLEAAALVSLPSAGDAENEALLAAIPTRPLVACRLVEARVLGRRAQTFLERRELLDAGKSDGVETDAWVLDVPSALLDQGRGSGLEAGTLVLAGRRVWGKVVSAGEHVSQVRRAVEPGYRDLVRLAHVQSGKLALGPRGVLEGVGENLCRIRLVPVTEAVSLGDVVLTDGGEGLTSVPFLYGQVIKLEQPAGATHWDIWMRPALSEDPETVAVLSAAVSLADAAQGHIKVGAGSAASQSLGNR